MKLCAGVALLLPGMSVGEKGTDSKSSGGKKVLYNMYSTVCTVFVKTDVVEQQTTLNSRNSCVRSKARAT